MSILSVTEAILSLGGGNAWRFSVKGPVTDAASFAQYVIWPDDIAQTDWATVSSALSAGEDVVNNRQLRARRDELLAETDWWVVSDRTPTPAQLAYRKALRDLPANTADLATPNWPVKP